MSFSSRISLISRLLSISASAALLALGAPIARAQQIVAPNSLAAVEGDTNNRFPLLVNGGMRYQQVYNASQFAGIGVGNVITQITLRPDAQIGAAFTRTLSNVTFRLSTTAAAADGLSTTFASNLGGDATIVRSGPITLSSAFTGPANGPKDFDVIINLTTPFTYNPALGNLLLDVANFSPENNNLNLGLDAVNVLSDSVSRVFGGEGNPPATTGTADSLGLVTRFTFAPGTVTGPEPGTLALLALGMVGGIIARRKK